MIFWVIPQLHFLVHTLLVTCNQMSNFPHVFLTSTVGFYGGKLIEEHALKQHWWCNCNQQQNGGRFYI